MDTNTQVKPVETPPAAKAKKPIYKRWWAIALAAVFVIGGISQGVAMTPSRSPPRPPRVRRSRRSLSPRPRSRSRRLRRPHRLRRPSRSQHQHQLSRL